MWLVVQKFLETWFFFSTAGKNNQLFSSLFPLFFLPSVVYHMCVFPVPASEKLIFFLSQFLSWKENIHIVSHLGGKKTKQWCLCRWLLTDEEVTLFFFFSFRLVSLLCVVVVSSLCLWQKKSWIFESRVRFFFLFCLGFCQSAQTNKQPQVFLFLVVTRSF